MPVIRMAVLMGALLLTAACGNPTTSTPGGAQQTTTAATTTATSTAAGHQPSQAPPAPEQLRFTAKTVDGADFDAASLAGKPAVLWFWAPWCPKCNAEASGLRDVVEANAGAVTFVGVAGLDAVPAMQQFVQKYSLGSFTHLVDADGALWRRFGVTHQPAYAFVSAAGEVQVEKHQLSKDELASRVAALTGR